VSGNGSSFKMCYSYQHIGHNRRAKFRHHAELVIILLIVIYFTFSTSLISIPLCPFNYFLHYPCPTCGTTRSIWHLLHGNFKLAWSFNPIGFVVMFLLFRRMSYLLLPKFRWQQYVNSNLFNHVLMIIYILLGLLRIVSVL
jgi:hypothetical protein